MCLVPTNLSPAPHTQPEAGLFLQHDCERQPDIAEIPELGSRIRRWDPLAKAVYSLTRRPQQVMRLLCGYVRLRVITMEHSGALFDINKAENSVVNCKCQKLRLGDLRSTLCGYVTTGT
jgi:hypothetical protein